MIGLFSSHFLRRHKMAGRASVVVSLLFSASLWSLLSRVDGAPANLSPAAHRAVPAVISEHPFGTSPVHMATSASGFREFVAQHLTAGDVVIVLFFSRHCPHCIRFKVTYRRLADRLGQRVKTEKNGAFFAAVDAGAAQVTDQEDSIWDILREFRVSFIPDVRLLVPLHRVRSAADEDGAELKNESPGTAKELGPDYGSLAAWTLQVSHHEMSEDGIDTLLRTYIETTGLDKLEENDEQFSEKRRSRQEILESNLKLLEAVCPTTEFPPAPVGSPVPALCRGGERWSPDAERVSGETPGNRLHDALAVFLHVLRRWIVASDSSLHLSLEKELALARFLELALYALPGKAIKGAIFRLLLHLRTLGSGLQPLPQSLLSREEFHAALEKASRMGEAGADENAAAETASTAWTVTSKPPSEPQSEVEGELPFVSLLRKDNWEKRLTDFKVADVSGADAFPGAQQPAMRHCSTVLCGVWTLFHVIAEGLQTQFQRKVRLARERGAPLPQAHETQRQTDKSETEHADRERQTEMYLLSQASEEEQTRAEQARSGRIDLKFLGPYDSLTVFATQKYKELLRQEEHEHLHRQDRDTPNLRGESRRETDVSFMIEALEETFGPVKNKQALSALEEELLVEERRSILPANVAMASLRDWLFSFFMCVACRTHFLQCFEQGFYGREQVTPPTAVKQESLAALAQKRMEFQGGLSSFVEKLGEKSNSSPSAVASVVAARLAAGGSLSDAEREMLLSHLPASLWLSGEFFRVRDPLDVAEEEENLRNFALWLWRLHNAVTVRTAAEAIVEVLVDETLDVSSVSRAQPSNATPGFSATGEPLGIGEMAKRGLGSAYFLHTDPRWPPAQVASCLREDAAPFELGFDFVAARGATDAVHLCENVDFSGDFDLEKIRQWLRKTYWGSTWGETASDVDEGAVSKARLQSPGSSRRDVEADDQ
ncbi:hypothetical protein TGME49_269950 [Toxoplasma gondii ME49]|uniref:Thioredoxin domain-containing protein n=1 Tax=Toxoplasma gondii (strain ATCC 50611 / Me49) TaxID=508771 RepID=S8EY87_TOXGM|nr:hypothetical protein TGME49_269950 [Toxoplasma gondii ME49]EPT28376.1 hypothetical protein TGME49_269950 [Toxoplasma gondii ME49]|eukprot:XP_002365673.1 hypothetical protein TGME49_269950 [Toxoplasma gondii ME49]